MIREAAKKRYCALKKVYLYYIERNQHEFKFQDLRSNPDLIELLPIKSERERILKDFCLNGDVSVKMIDTYKEILNKLI